MHFRHHQQQLQLVSVSYEGALNVTELYKNKVMLFSHKYLNIITKLQTNWFTATGVNMGQPCQPAIHYLRA